ncbi:MAG TPA: glycoside hydrolase family 15 protein [Streptosporangiaceae bacterium]|nr:glycoside hydrolase family 15 protein [Streptosporangiaceae bacterium]
MERYPNIEDHGLIGDLQTAALVTTDGVVDWFCVPRFDSPSVFASLLDAGKGGFCRIAPDRDDYTSKQLYLPDSAILVTRFMTSDGVGEVHDFMPIAGGKVTEQHRLVRNVKVVRGTMKFRIQVFPAFNYGRTPHKLQYSEHGAMFHTDDLQLSVHGIAPLGASLRDLNFAIEPDGRGLQWTRTLHEGEIGGVMLESNGGVPQRLIPPEEAQQIADETASFWKNWLHRSTYTGRWREVVSRSAMTLKLMTYAPTGALVAAPTTGLPEQVGGERNWDYRYTWIRDASFSIYALLGLGYLEEAAQFMQWIRDRTIERAGDGAGPLQIMYRVDGTSDLTEETLDHFEGWRGSRPVRVGNGAANQLQLDIYGECMDAIALADDRTAEMAHEGWMAIASITDWLCDHWDQPDEGIWETRGGRKNFTYGRFQSWVALDRAIRIASRRAKPANLVRWTAERDKIYNQIMDRGWHPKIGAFTQHYDTDVLDSSLLMMPLMGFIAPRDPMWTSTLTAMDRELVSDSLVYRYNPSASPDGLAGQEGTFSLCTFWYVDALARAGRLDDARLTFEKMGTYTNHLGLYSEEISATGEQIGNFPQAFSHLALINAAINLNYQMDHGIGSLQAAHAPVLSGG